MHIPKFNVDFQAVWQLLLQWLRWVLAITNNQEFV